MNRMQTTGRGNSAFTLIELLVVIAIIAILAAILFPVFAQAREKARQAACISNMKQLGLGIAQYTQDFDELVPPSQNGDDDYLVSWPTMIYPYVKNADVFVCPNADETPTRADPKFVTQLGANPRNYVGITVTVGDAGGDGSHSSKSLVPRLSYGRNLIPAVNGNAWTATNGGAPIANGGRTYPNWSSAANPKFGWAGMFNGAVGGGTTTPVALPDVANPAGTIHIVDAMAGTFNAASSPGFGGSMRGLQQDIRTDMFPNDTPSKVAARHNGGFSTLYGDGHAGWRVWGKSLPCEWTVQDDNCN